MGADASEHAWVVIPARGGSVGIPRKNLRLLGGKPLLAYVIDTALKLLPASRVIVVTDDDEIANVAEHFGATAIRETMRTPGDETLDTKIVRNLPRLRAMGAAEDDIVVTVQPTSPLLRLETLQAALSMLEQPDACSVITVVNDRHLRWKISDSGDPVPAFSERLNRQQLPAEYRETGAVIAARLHDIERHRSRVISPIRIIEVAEDEAVDIDSYSDLYMAAHLLSRKTIAIRVDASRSLGMGHVYRMHALASELARHEVTIYLGSDMPLGHEFFERFPYKTRIIQSHDEFCSNLEESRPDLVVLDLLDTDRASMVQIRKAAPSAKILTFEDCGSGSEEADLLVSEFVDNPAVPDWRKLSGIDHALLSPIFEITRPSFDAPRDEVEEVVLLFGGTDPSMLGQRAFDSLVRVGYRGRVTAVRGLGAAPICVPDEIPFELRVRENVTDMATLIDQADFAYTSAGRTIIELLSRGVPSICLAQNAKELTHTHVTAESGIVALGLGSEVSDHELDDATGKMLADAELRHEMTRRARVAGARRSNRTTIAAILDRLDLNDLTNI